MTTATTESKTTAEPALDVACVFGGFSKAADDKCRLGVKIPPGEMNVMVAEAMFVGMQLTGRLRVQPAGDGQKSYLDDVDVRHEVQGVFEVGRFSRSPDGIGISLLTNPKSVDVAELMQFPKQTGRLVVELVQPLEDGKAPAAYELDDDEDWDDDDEE